MANNSIIPMKVYFLHEDSGEYEIRRFNLELPVFKVLVEKIRILFPGLFNKVFSIYWRDEEEEEVAISSDEELAIVVTSPCQVKKLFVRIPSEARIPKQVDNEAVHFGVYCDGCDKNISGIRYKCGVCYDYDLCSFCRESGIHEEHPMYRIPHPCNPVSAIGISISKHKNRKHSESGKKKRRFDKRESGPETGDESEEMCHGRYFHKKCKKAYKCRCKKEGKSCGKTWGGDETNRFYGAGPYSQMVNDFLGYFNPVHFQPRPTECQNPTKESATNENEIPTNASYLKNLGSTLQKILDPLGVSVEFEVRQKKETKEEKKNEKEEEKQSPASDSPQKEVRFAVDEQLPETMMQKIEEVTKILANQTINNSSDNDNGWVSFEELKKDSEESSPQPSSRAEVPKPPQQPKPSAPAPEEQASSSQNLYPNLTPRVPSNPKVRAALENMLAMGFTNEGNWLTSLLEAKNGNIDQALEALSIQKNVGQ